MCLCFCCAEIWQRENVSAMGRRPVGIVVGVASPAGELLGRGGQERQPRAPGRKPCVRHALPQGPRQSAARNLRPDQGLLAHVWLVWSLRRGGLAENHQRRYFWKWH